MLTAGRMNPCANDFVPGRRTRPSPINTSLAAATLLPSGATQSAPAVGPGLQFGHSRDVANNPTTLTTRSRQEMNNGSLSAPSQYFSQPSATNTNTDDNMSEASAISAHYLEMRPELAGQKPEVFVQTSHPRGFKRFTMANNIEMKEAYEGAYGIVTNINPDYYIMPYGVSHRRSLSVTLLTASRLVSSTSRLTSRRTYTTQYGIVSGQRSRRSHSG